MIYKQKEDQLRRSANEKKGDAAELQMAFYLRRYFSESAEINVLNDVCLTFKGEAAQIDHLIITPYRWWIVESKSISGKIIIQEDGQWIKQFSSREFGFASPIHQAKLQGRILEANFKNYFMNTNRGGRPLSILVAISDDGIIEDHRSQRGDVLKSDLVCERILQVYEQDRQDAQERAIQRGYSLPAGVYRAQSEEDSMYFLLASQVCKLAKSGDRFPIDGGISRVTQIAANSFKELVKILLEENQPRLNEFYRELRNSWLVYAANDIIDEDIASFLESGTPPRYVEAMCHIAVLCSMQEKSTIFWDEHRKYFKKVQRDLVLSGAIRFDRLKRRSS